MAKVFWPDETVGQIDAIVDYIELFDPRAAMMVADRLIALGNSLDSFSHCGRPAPDGTRELVGVRPYILRYRVLPDGNVVVLGVRHAARQPDQD